MSCANHSIYINGHNINLAHFSVFHKTSSGTWEAVADGAALQALLKRKNAESVVLSVCPKDTVADDADQGWVTVTSSKFILGKGKQVANGKTDPLFEDRTQTQTGRDVRDAAVLISSALAPTILAGEAKKSKNWRAAQAVALVQLEASMRSRKQRTLEERLFGAQGAEREEAFMSAVSVLHGSSAAELVSRHISAADIRSGNAIERLAELVDRDLLEPALAVLKHDNQTGPGRQYLDGVATQRSQLGLYEAARIAETAREERMPLDIFASVLQSCAPATNPALVAVALRHPVVRQAVEQAVNTLPSSTDATPLDVADMAGSFTNLSSVGAVRMDGGPATMDGLEHLLFNVDIWEPETVVAGQLFLRAGPSEGGSDPQRCTTPALAASAGTAADPSELSRAAIALKAAEFALAAQRLRYESSESKASRKSTFYAVAQEIESLTGGVPVDRVRDVLVAAGTAEDAQRLTRLDAAVQRAKAEVAGLLQDGVHYTVWDPRKWDDRFWTGTRGRNVSSLAAALVDSGDPSLMLRTVVGGDESLQLMRFAVSRGLVPRAEPAPQYVAAALLSSLGHAQAQS